MAGQRQYDDPCGIARALDLLGERWALLVVRELCFVGKRFSQLRRDLPGVSPNVLSQRLDQLVGAGVVQQRQLPAPVSSTVYELTERGRAIQPILIELGRWGSQVALSGRGRLSTSALLLALKTTFVTGGAPASYQLVVAGEPFGLTLAPAAIEVGAGELDRPDTTLTGDGDLVRGLAFGDLSLAEAEAAGLTVTGSRRVAAALPRRFRRPATVPPS